ncbi:MAG TPA: hypothetical protein VKT51_11400 [Candidatus Eremiobacteraceae bacterium]|nr:hypothetical protein [Candidatus Eremiobacteraceae bacterium]
MTETASSVLGPWSNFYTITGSSAGALTGLMFVVITLVTGVERSKRNRDGISAFSTPTVIHFGAALLVSAILSAPWPSLAYPASLLAIAGILADLYILRVWLITKRFKDYTPDFEDWIFYTILPLAAYSVILAGAIMLNSSPVAPFALAAAALLLIFIGIRNAWDVVTYIAIERTPSP